MSYVICEQQRRRSAPETPEDTFSHDEAHIHLLRYTVGNIIEPFMPYANNKVSDQPAHPRNLISAFVVRYLDSTISLVSISEISNL